MGKGHGKKFFKALFSYFIVLIVSRILGRFLLSVSVSLRLGYSADVFLSVPHCPLCVLSAKYSFNNVSPFVFQSKVFLLNLNAKLNEDKMTCYRTISSLNSFSFSFSRFCVHVVLRNQVHGRASNCKSPCPRSYAAVK